MGDQGSNPMLVNMVRNLSDVPGARRTLGKVRRPFERYSLRLRAQKSRG